MASTSDWISAFQSTFEGLVEALLVVLVVELEVDGVVVVVELPAPLTVMTYPPKR